MKEKLPEEPQADAKIYHLGEYVAKHIGLTVVARALASDSDDLPMIEHAAEINNFYADREMPLVPGENAKNAEPFDMTLFQYPRSQIELTTLAYEASLPNTPEKS
jgi:hypothetical protein